MGKPIHRSDDPKLYNEFQLAKLRGFSCIRTIAAIQPIWEYFHSTKEVVAQCMLLVEEMRARARKNDVQINRSIYFDKAFMDNIVKMEFGPDMPTAHLSTAEQGISILMC